MKLETDMIHAMIFGHAIGDALGVPVEFLSHGELSKHPVTDMRGFGTYNVPAGSWSDDTSMTLCLMESLARLGRVDYDDIMKNFLCWMNEAKFTPTGVMFDIGRATRQALMRYAKGEKPLICGGRSGHDNGNGSLMRISPIALYLFRRKGAQLDGDDLRLVHEVSSLTHAHVRSQMACGIYTLIAVRLLSGSATEKALGDGILAAHDFYGSVEAFSDEMKTYERLWDMDVFRTLPAREIKSSGYVVDTLEAVLWCLLNTGSFRECVLKAVNLGEDTDTVAAIAGGLAGLAYGWDGIPQEWKDGLQRADLIDGIFRDFVKMLEGDG